ncbi:MAG: cyclic nucleotide-binding domain-containing protein [Gemmatimonadota bacterium]
MSPSDSALGSKRVAVLLRRIPLFAELPEDAMERLCQAAHRSRYPAGATLIQEGTPGDGLYVVVHGELEVSTRQAGGEELVLARRGPGEVLGEMSLLERAPRTATVRATVDTDVVVLPPEAFQRLLANRPEIAARILTTMATRLRSTEASLMTREKLASLGTLAAGLAHELNNPAAAIRRATHQLRETAVEWRRWSSELARLSLDADQAALLRSLESAEPGGTPSGALAAAEAEERLAEWLETLGVDGAAEAAAPLTAAGWTYDGLERARQAFDAGTLRVVLGWLATTLTARELLGEIDVSAEAIAGIVGAAKSYTFMDRGPVQTVDLAATLEDTLTILRSALVDGVEVERDFADVGPIQGFGSELTQVWTNLIDNAVDAMDGRGTLTLRIRPDPGDADQVIVEVIDSGPGIPAARRSRIFEPFFTTKGPGKGSGLGLHIVRDIVVNRHAGRIDVESEPGRTTFRVRLPRRLRRGDQSSGENTR